MTYLWSCSKCHCILALLLHQAVSSCPKERPQPPEVGHGRGLHTQPVPGTRRGLVCRRRQNSWSVLGPPQHDTEETHGSSSGHKPHWERRADTVPIKGLFTLIIWIFTGRFKKYPGKDGLEVTPCVVKNTRVFNQAIFSQIESECGMSCRQLCDSGWPYIHQSQTRQTSERFIIRWKNRRLSGSYDTGHLASIHARG